MLEGSWNVESPTGSRVGMTIVEPAEPGTEVDTEHANIGLTGVLNDDVPPIAEDHAGISIAVVEEKVHYPTRRIRRATPEVTSDVAVAKP